MSLEQRLHALMERDYSHLSAAQRQQVLDRLREQKLNILITGPTGAGKSSTINALFNTDVAQVGFGADPMTMDIRCYDFGNLILWDSPGLGDGVAADARHAEKLAAKLHEKAADESFLIDLVLVVLDGSSRDMGTSFRLINEVIIPNLGDNPADRLLVAINQADIAYKGPGGWDRQNHCPTEEGMKFLDSKATNVRERILGSTGVRVEPICYSAGLQSSSHSTPPFNLLKLLAAIVEKSPAEKRLSIRENVSQEDESWKKSDGRADYGKEVKKSFGLGQVVGALIGGLFGFFSI